MGARTGIKEVLLGPPPPVLGIFCITDFLRMSDGFCVGSGSPEVNFFRSDFCVGSEVDFLRGCGVVDFLRVGILGSGSCPV